MQPQMGSPPSASMLGAVGQSGAAQQVAKQVADRRAALLKAEQEQAMAAAAERQRVRELSEREMGLMEIMEQMAVSSNLLFMPNSKRPMQDGKPLYTFGSVTCMLDVPRKLVYVMREGQWMPISLRELLDRAAS